MGIYTAVHNFCTSQKAVSSGNTGVIGGAHRGGRFRRLRSTVGGKANPVQRIYLEKTCTTISSHI